MKLGLIPINVGGPGLRKASELAQAAEEAGVESLWTCEHVIVPVDYDSVYPYSRSGKMPMGPETHLVDPLVMLAFLAGCTRTIKLGTGINILPQANPLMLAKQVASLDFMSGGRLLFGVGIGWLEEEFRAMGTPFERRGARFRDYLTAMRKVWSGEVVEHDGEFIRWSGFKSYPLPHQEQVPVVIGGSSEAALRRVVDCGAGWIAPPAPLEAVRRLIGKLTAMAEQAGRDPTTVEITAMHPPVDLDPKTLRDYEDAGAHRVLVPLVSLPGRSPVEGVQSLAPILAELA